MKNPPDILVNHDRLNNRRYLILSLYLRSDLFSFLGEKLFGQGRYMAQRYSIENIRFSSILVCLLDFYE